MLFIIKNSQKQPKELFKNRIFIIARNSIIATTLTTSEVKMDRYLRNNYKKGLKQLSLMILNKAIITENGKEEFFISLTDNDLDTIAGLITYGNSEIKGTRFLQRTLGDK